MFYDDYSITLGSLISLALKTQFRENKQLKRNKSRCVPSFVSLSLLLALGTHRYCFVRILAKSKGNIFPLHRCSGQRLYDGACRASAIA